MKIAVIGRTEILIDTAQLLIEHGHRIVCVITAKEAPEYLSTREDFARLAEELGVPFSSTPRITEQQRILENSQADIAVSTNYVGIIPARITDLFPCGILNAHGGDLPRYRGNACLAWAILNGEERIGLGIHKMIGGELDSGDIIARDYLPIDYNTKVTQAWDWVRERVPTLMLEAVELLSGDPSYVLEHQSKDPADALRCYPRRPEDGRIDWQQPALNVLRLINASNKPYAGAFCEFEGKKMIIWDAELVDDNENFCAIPGQITLVGNGFVEVACRNEKLRIKEIEIGTQLSSPDLHIKSIRKRLF